MAAFYPVNWVAQVYMLYITYMYMFNSQNPPVAKTGDVVMPDSLASSVLDFPPFIGHKKMTFSMLLLSIVITAFMY